MDINITTLQSALAASQKPPVGEWIASVDEDGCVFLVHEMPVEDAPADMYGDEPWSAWGGDEIIKHFREPDDCGTEEYPNKYGWIVQSQWVRWDTE